MINYIFRVSLKFKLLLIMPLLDNNESSSTSRRDCIYDSFSNRVHFRRDHWLRFLKEGYNNPSTEDDNSLVYFNYTKARLEEIQSLVNNEDTFVQISIVRGNPVEDHNYDLYRSPILYYDEIRNLRQVFRNILVELISHFSDNSENPHYNLYEIAFDNRNDINMIDISLEYEDLNVYLENGEIDEEIRMREGVFVSIQFRVSLEEGLNLFCNFLNSSRPTEPHRA